LPLPAMFLSPGAVGDRTSDASCCAAPRHAQRQAVSHNGSCLQRVWVQLCCGGACIVGVFASSTAAQDLSLLHTTSAGVCVSAGCCSGCGPSTAGLLTAAPQHVRCMYSSRVHSLVVQQLRVQASGHLCRRLFDLSTADALPMFGACWGLREPTC
jgi:hypothetical protein